MKHIVPPDAVAARTRTAEPRAAPTSIRALIAQSLAIEAEEAGEAGALGFVARAMTLACLPHSRVEGVEFERTNGLYTLSITSPSSVGLPYGSVPRLLLAWMTTEATRTGRRELDLGDSMSGFMHQLGLVPTGGRWGSVGRLKDQTTRLLASSFTAVYRDKAGVSLCGHKIADHAALWWTPKDPRQASLWSSTVILGEPFFREITTHPVPIDVRALRALKRSPMALDVYTWLTYRQSYLKKPTQVPWDALQAQFGADYPRTGQGRRDFRKWFCHALDKVLLVYRGARATPSVTGLLLAPGRPHVPKRWSGP
jgi:hypothetical protein